MNLIKICLVMLASYLIGSIISGDIVAFFKKVNLRQQGSGNVGATNVFRTMGSFYGGLVLFADAMKGIIAVLLGGLLGQVGGFDLSVITGVLAIVGHNWPVFTKFRGGKGVATSLGVTLALTPLALSIPVAVFAVSFLLSGYVSLGSILAAVSYPVSVLVFYPNDYLKLAFALVVAAMIIYRHRTNIQRIYRGEESRILYKKKKESQPK